MKRLGLALLVAVLYAGTLASRELIRDDRPLIVENALLRSWRSLPRLLTTGYWDQAQGPGARVQEYRPALSLLNFAVFQAAGEAPWTHHLVNLLLHAAVCLLLFELLSRSAGEKAAFCAAALFACLPIHCEAVGYVSGRSEPLCALFMLAAWLCADSGKSPWALVLYALAMLSKEQGILFPLLVIGWDRVQGRRRLPLYIGLGLCSIAYLLLRSTVLEHSWRVGVPYFGQATFPVRLLTMARFTVERYLIPLATGLNMGFNFERPFIPDSGLGDVRAWLCLAALLAAALGSLRRPWVLAAFLWWLPVSNLIVPLDELGAPRFMYFPAAALCAATAPALARVPPAAFAALLLWYGGWTVHTNRLWRDSCTYNAEVRARNPHAHVLPALAVCRLRQGDAAGAEALLREAIAQDPSDVVAHYDLGRLLFEKGDLRQAEASFLRASPNDADVRVFRSLIAEREGRPAQAQKHLEAALSTRPWDCRARFNHGRLLWGSGRREAAERDFREFLRLCPSDEDSGAVRELLRNGSRTRS
ncbi:MAG: tetratricopeptide repeat protein [Elusimicrobiota bacterium]